MKRFARRPVTKKFKLDDGIEEELKISALKVKDFDLIKMMGNPDTQQDAQKEIIKRVFEQNKIEWEDEIYQELDWNVVDVILEVVMNLNNIEISDAKVKFIEDIKKKQQASQEKKQKTTV